MTPDAAARFQAEFFGRCPGVESLISLMETVPSGYLFVKDRQCRYVRANVPAFSTYGLKDEAGLIGRRNQDFFPSLLAKAYESEDERVMSSGKPVIGEIWLVPNIFGTPRWYNSSKSPIFDTAREVIGLVGLMHPITTPDDQRTHFQELQRVMEFIEGNFLDEITVERLAEIAGISVPHFNRRFRQLLRLSPMEYVHSLRIQEAQRLLATTDQAIAEIALFTGHYDQSHFTKRFRAALGMTPLAYRKRYRR